MDFTQFFRKATGREPFPYQRELAEGPEFPDLLEAPTGAGKTAAAILGWLWRRRFASETIRKSTPRRLIYCLPMRVLVEQTHDEARKWLANLGLETEISVHVLMGGEDACEWDLCPERDAILIGTQDMLLSRALNRGYGMSRYRWPMHFALLNNDCLWVFDEIQLMGSGLASAAQLAAFRDALGRCFPVHSLWMSATLRRDWLRTVDFSEKVDGLKPCQIGDSDRQQSELRKRLTAKKTLRKLDNPKKIERAILEACTEGALVLAVFNTVKRARDRYEGIMKLLQQQGERGSRRKRSGCASKEESQPEVVLIHSQFRPNERKALLDKALSRLPEKGRVVISTQVVEAGVDISAKHLLTELAPWPSLVQRFGRCNRFGEHEEARVSWINVSTDKKGSAAPYQEEELDAARRQLGELADVGPESLEKHLVRLTGDEKSNLYSYSPEHVIRRKDMIDLFDTTPDLAGNDIDISRFIRETVDHDVLVFWRDVGSPGKKEPRPERQELCPVPTASFREFATKHKVYRWDFLDGKWKSARNTEIIPGGFYLVPCAEGGYTQDAGWSPQSSDTVGPIFLPSAAASPPENDSGDSHSRTDWRTITQHTNETVAQLQRVLNVLRLPKTDWDVLRLAVRWHDRGKAHDVFQKAICGDRASIEGILAKAPEMRRYGRKGFRHELASALAMLQQGLPDLACYLAAAHHGKVRMSIRSLPHEKQPEDGKRFARGIWDGDVLPQVELGDGIVAPHVSLSLEPMELGVSADGSSSWAERMLKLRDGLGPFRLAFLETLLRVADMRASDMGKKEDPNA